MTGEVGAQVEAAAKVPDVWRGARLTAQGAVSASLARYDDRALRALVDEAVPLGSGIGGTSALLEIAGTPVFVKRVPLTDLERHPGAVRSTANVFGLPVFCQYGIGGPGFGAWRELAVHAMTTDWVRAGQYEGFPLMYHWRVLPDSTPLPDELADVDRVVAFWGGGPEIRRRLEELQRASASIALFLEYIPQNLHQWLGRRMAAGGEAADLACTMVERDLAAGISFMNSRGLLHFDAHFENVLTDGRRLFFTDFGLSLSSRFELSREESDFFGRHESYDRGYSTSHLVHWLVTALHGSGSNGSGGEGYGRDEREAQVRAYARGATPTGMPEVAAAILTRHAPLGAVMADFFHRLRDESRQTPYPLEEIRRVEARGVRPPPS